MPAPPPASGSSAIDRPLDLLVLGSGVAGLSAAVRAADTHGMRVGVLTKGQLHQATTRWAQGGVAAVLGDDPDSTDLHLADTLAAGAGLCDPDAVRVLVDEGPGRVNELIAQGAMFDRDAKGELLLAREGGHSHPRVVHAGGAATGVEVERALVAAVHETAAAVYEHWFALDLLVERGRCAGVVALGPDRERSPVRARHVLVATGGAGQLFAVTTNPTESTGDGMAMALRAGVAVADLEFVQFHPTALHHPSMPRPLLSEALRGHGALLRDARGQRFVDELLPRDRVSQAIMAKVSAQGTDHVWLDATGLERFGERFPTIAASLAAAGLDPSADWLPVAPAAHYTCGGIVADLDGASSLPGLWVAGEAACNGVHGANRLASNSLLDGMVFGPRVVEAVERGKDGPEATGAMRCVLDGPHGRGPAASGREVAGRRLVPPRPAPPAERATPPPVDEVTKARASLQRSMTAGAGVLRSAASLDRAREAAGLAVAGATGPAAVPGPDVVELDNLATVARALCACALARTESRGAHARSDHPDLDPAQRVRYVVGGPDTAVARAEG
ncbi:MAG TPA: FAD-binding protein [Acidimicrobiales bacterium]|nr:FAD-binding protein [Acidimicrobiales bacterium]